MYDNDPTDTMSNNQIQNIFRTMTVSNQFSYILK